jgi:hypothetical protein
MRRQSVTRTVHECACRAGRTRSRSPSKLPFVHPQKMVIHRGTRVPGWGRASKLSVTRWGRQTRERRRELSSPEHQAFSGSPCGQSGEQQEGDVLRLYCDSLSCQIMGTVSCFIMNQPRHLPLETHKALRSVDSCLSLSPAIVPLPHPFPGSQQRSSQKGRGRATNIAGLCLLLGGLWRFRSLDVRLRTTRCCYVGLISASVVVVVVPRFQSTWYECTSLLDHM